MGSWAYGYIVLPASGLLLLALKYSLQVYFYQRLAASVQWLRVPIGLLAYLPDLSLFSSAILVQCFHCYLNFFVLCSFQGACKRSLQVSSLLSYVSGFGYSSWESLPTTGDRRPVTESLMDFQN